MTIHNKAEPCPGSVMHSDHAQFNQGWCLAAGRYCRHASVQACRTSKAAPVTGDVVETVARAICQAGCVGNQTPDDLMGVQHLPRYEKTPPYRWELHIRQSEAALEAARPCSPKLLDGVDLRAFCERLFKATDAREIDTLIGEAAGYLEAQSIRIEQLEAQASGLERLREALNPFVREIDRLDREYDLAGRPSHQAQTLMISLGDILGLRAALQHSTQPPSGSSHEQD
jgi:hypothetical protein